MTSTRIFFFLLGFLATSAVAYRLELHQVDVLELSGNETGKDLWHFENKADEQLPTVCEACKLIVKKVKKSLPRDNSETQNEVKNKLNRVCDKIGFLKLCKKFVTKSIDILVEELSTSDDAETTCINLRACRSKSTAEDIVESMWRKKIQ